MSDPYDDDDDFFDSPETLDVLAQVETQALQASQASKATQQQQSAAAAFRPPFRKIAHDGHPLGTGMALGTGIGTQKEGYHHVALRSRRNRDTRIGFQPPFKQNTLASSAALARKSSDCRQSPSGAIQDEDYPPIDVVMDASGKYELSGYPEDAEVTDNRCNHNLALGESLGISIRAQGSQGQGTVGSRRKQAIAQALNNHRTVSSPTGSPQVQGQAGKTLSKSNSSLTMQFSPIDSSRPPPTAIHNNQKNPLVKSTSAGAQVSRLFPSSTPTYVAPEENLSTTPDDSVVAPIALNSHYEELKKETQRRQALEAELAKLKTQKTDQNQGNGKGDAEEQLWEKKAQELQNQIWAAKGEAENIRRAQREEKDKYLQEIEKLKQALMSREKDMNEREAQTKRVVEGIKHQAIFSNHAIQASALKARSSQAPRTLQPKNGGSPGWHNPLPTSMRNGSPSHSHSHVHSRSPFRDYEATPLARARTGARNMLGSSAQGGAIGGFYNAFAATPTVSSRKRQKTDHQPQLQRQTETLADSLDNKTPVRNQAFKGQLRHGQLPNKSPLASPSKSQPQSPSKTESRVVRQDIFSSVSCSSSPARSKQGSSAGINAELDICLHPALDRNDDITGEQKKEEKEVDDPSWEGEIHVDHILPQHDEKAEFLYHLLTSTPLSNFQGLLGFTTEPTIYRILNYQSLRSKGRSGRDERREIHPALCGELLKLVAVAGGPIVTENLENGQQGQFEAQRLEEIGKGVLDKLGDMLELFCCSLEAEDNGSQNVSYHEIAIVNNILNLLASSFYFFPSLVPFIPLTNIISSLLSLVPLLSNIQKMDKLQKRLADSWKKEMNQGDTDKDESQRENEHGTEEKIDTGQELHTGGNEERLKSWCLEMGGEIARMSEIICLFAEGGIWQGSELVDVILGLTDPGLDKYIIKHGLEVYFAAALRKYAANFPLLITSSPNYLFSSASHASSTDAQSPLIDRLCRYLISPHPSLSIQEAHDTALMIVRGMCMMAVADTESVVLMGARSILVPALVLILKAESGKIWGVHSKPYSTKDALALLQPALSLLHHLVFPFPPLASTSLGLGNIVSAGGIIATPQRQHLRPSQCGSDAPLGINLAECLHTANSMKEFTGLQHVFVSAMGCMAYGLFGDGMDDDNDIEEGDLRAIQVLSGDLLENIVEGPEGDAIYEMYVYNEDEESREHARIRDRGNTIGKEDEELSVDEDVYNEIDALEVNN
nr:hypothetical protein L204_01602 [Cryptococcus depauperatus CBS 7855]